MSVLIVTSLGDIVVDLNTDRCPLTCKNFLKLCKIKYYNGCLFHKVQKDFIAQVGDRTGTGNSGESIYKFLYGDQAQFFDDEIHPDLKHSKTGIIAMASAGKNCNASQFYFTLREDLDYLDGKHTVFGIVEEEEGLETLSRINEAYVDPEGRPFKDIRIKHTYILDDPYPDPPQLAELIPDRSPEGKPNDETAEPRLEDDWVPMDETIGPAELEERIRAREAHTNLAILESIGDIPDAEIKPPDNVLFVCKLNPVTQDEDLYTIFSRFGNVIAADIIRDWKTGDSLCYAFIEFESKDSCEMAYFKMDNTLIDDRRIHVDFSQSVSKLWAKYRHGKKTQTEGSGCFKCGAPDHIAKDCSGAPNDINKSQKYVLKDTDAQRGGTDNQSYEMVFEGDAFVEETTRSQKTEKHLRDRSHAEGPRKRYQDHDRDRDTARDRGDGERDGARDRERSIDRERDKDRGRERDKPWEKNREQERDRGRERDKPWEKNREQERDRGRDENREQERDRRRDGDRGRERGRMRDAYRDRERDRDREDKERERGRDRDREDKKRERDRDREDRERERDRRMDKHRNREQPQKDERENDFRSGRKHKPEKDEHEDRHFTSKAGEAAGYRERRSRDEVRRQ